MNTLENSTLQLHLHGIVHMTQVVQLLVHEHPSMNHYHHVYCQELDKVQVVYRYVLFQQ
jgi:hypothetical protein